MKKTGREVVPIKDGPIYREIQSLVGERGTRGAIRSLVRQNVIRAGELASAASINGQRFPAIDSIDPDQIVTVAGLEELAYGAAYGVKTLSAGLSVVNAIVLPPRRGSLEETLGVEDWLPETAARDLSTVARGFSGLAGRVARFDFLGAWRAGQQMGLMKRFNDSIGVLQPVLQISMEAAAALPGLLKNAMSVRDDFLLGQDKMTQTRIVVLELIEKLRAARLLMDGKAPEVSAYLEKLASELNGFTLNNASLDELEAAFNFCELVEREATEVIEAHGASMELPGWIALAGNSYLTQFAQSDVARTALAMSRRSIQACLMLHQFSAATMTNVIGATLEIAQAAQQRQMGEIEGAILAQIRETTAGRLMSLPGKLSDVRTVEQATTLMVDSARTAKKKVGEIVSEFREEDGE